MDQSNASAGRNSDLGVDVMITHLDEMFEDDGKNHDEFFNQFDLIEESHTTEATPETKHEVEEDWFNQIEEMDIHLFDDTQ
jgi:hypothetical protein